MRTVILGAAGQLGRDLAPRLAGEVVPLARSDAELTRPDALAVTLADLRPDIVINCAAYNFVDRAEQESAAAFAVNATGARDLARACRAAGCALVHFSTDYVFGLDEHRRTPYAEDDAPGPVSVYGASKLAGEYLVRAELPRHYVIRTCGLYGVWGSGGKGGNFVETMLRLAAQSKPLRVVADQVCTPSYAADVAAATAALVQTGRYGIYHVRNSGECSWHEFAAAVFELAAVRADLSAITTAEYGAAARRPAYSVLATGAAEQAGLGPLPHWRDALARYLRERAGRVFP